MAGTTHAPCTCTRRVCPSLTLHRTRASRVTLRRAHIRASRSSAANKHEGHLLLRYKVEPDAGGPSQRCPEERPLSPVVCRSGWRPGGRAAVRGTGLCGLLFPLSSLLHQPESVPAQDAAERKPSPRGRVRLCLIRYRGITAKNAILHLGAALSLR